MFGLRPMTALALAVLLCCGIELSLSNTEGNAATLSSQAAAEVAAAQKVVGETVGERIAREQRIFEEFGADIDQYRAKLARRAKPGGASRKPPVLVLVEQGNVSSLRQHLEQTRGRGVNEQDSLSNSPLHRAVAHLPSWPTETPWKQISLQMVVELLKWTPNLTVQNMRKHTPLETAIKYGNFKCVEALLDAGDCMACAKVSSLQLADNKPGGLGILDMIAYYSAYSNDDMAALFETKRGVKVSTLHQAAGTGNVEVLQSLLQQGADPAEFFGTHLQDQALHWAARNGQVETTMLLLASGAPTSVLDSGDDLPVYLAAKFNHSETGKLIIDAGGEHTLVEAAAVGHTERVKELIASGIDPEEARRERTQELPLHRAAKGNHVVTIKALLAAGANVNGVDKFGKTPLVYTADISIQTGRTILSLEAIETLIQAGGRDPTTICASASTEPEFMALESYFKTHVGSSPLNDVVEELESCRETRHIVLSKANHVRESERALDRVLAILQFWEQRIDDVLEREDL